MEELAKEGHPRSMAVHGIWQAYTERKRKEPVAAKTWYARAAKAVDALG